MTKERFKAMANRAIDGLTMWVCTDMGSYVIKANGTWPEYGGFTHIVYRPNSPMASHALQKCQKRMAVLAKWIAEGKAERARYQ